MTDLVNRSPEMPLVAGGPTPESARAAMERYQEISNALITSEDMQSFRTKKGTRTFPKRSAFQKLANAYRVSTEIKSRVVTHDDDGKIVRCDVVVRATHPDGRFQEGDGACARSEERFSGPGANVDKIDHDLPATAVTRAKNRAIGDLIAFGAVSAEEVEGGDPGGERTAGAGPGSLPAWAQPVRDVGGVAQAIHSLLELAGGAKPGATGRIGQRILDDCGDEVPLIAARVVNFIADELRPASAHDPVTPDASTTVAAGEEAEAGAGSEQDSAPPEADVVEDTTTNPEGAPDG